MLYVYLLRSCKNPKHRYKGITSDLKKRLRYHNAGKNRSTAPYRPWEVVVAIRFIDHARARAFERYLKSGSGKAFSNRHFW